MSDNKDDLKTNEAATVSEKIEALRKTEAGELDHDLLEDVSGGSADHTDSTHTDTTHTDSTHTDSTNAMV
jgi:hypothetical protein